MHTPRTTTRAGILALGLSFGLTIPLLAATLQDAPPETPKPVPGERAPEGERPAAGAADLPKAKQVVDSAIDAMGGREAFDEIKSMMFKIDMTSIQGSMKMEGYTARGGKFLVKQEMMGQQMRMGSDGKVGWYHAPMMGYDLIPDEDLPEARRQTELHTMILRIEEDFETIETVERTEFAGKPCYKLRMVPEQPKTDDDDEGASENEDDGAQFFYFNVEDKLLSGVETTHEMPFGAMTITMHFEEWKAFGDLKLFTRMRFNQMGQEMTLDWTELELDTVPEETFELPAEVKKLALERMMEEKPDAPAAPPAPGNDEKGN